MGCMSLMQYHQQYWGQLFAVFIIAYKQLVTNVVVL